jgi:hypothetical protein
MTQLWSSEDEQSLVWDSSIWPARLRLESSTLSKAGASTAEVLSESSVEDQSFISGRSSTTFETLDFNVSLGSPKVWSSEEEVGFRWGDSLWPGRLVREDSVVSTASANSPDIDSVSETGETALSSTASSGLVETSDSSRSITAAFRAGTVSSIGSTTEFSSSEETAPTVTVPSPTLQTDVFTSTDEETILSLSAGKTERTLSSSESNELLSIRSATSSVSLFAPDPNVETVAVSDEQGISPALSSIEGALEISSSIDESLSTETIVSPFESFEVRSVIERNVINPAISASSRSSRNLLSLDFDFLVDANPALLVSKDRETISSEDVTEIEDETNLAILEPSQNEVILE